VVSRSVRDSALALDLLAGAEPGDPYVAAAPPEAPYRELVRRAPRRLRIGLATASPIGTPVHAEAVAAAQGAAALLRELGHEVEEAAPAIDGAALARSFRHVYHGQVLATVRWALAHGARVTDFEPLTRFTAELGRAIDAGTLTTELIAWNGYARALGAFHQRYDALLTPTQAAPPQPHGAGDPSPVQEALMKALTVTGLARGLGRLGWLDATIEAIARDNMAPVPYTQLANLTGTPAMSVPLHWTADGLPIGVQFVGRMGDEATLLQVAAQLEQARPWFGRLSAIARG
jgi:amidase